MAASPMLTLSQNLLTNPVFNMVIGENTECIAIAIPELNTPITQSTENLDVNIEKIKSQFPNARLTVATSANSDFFSLLQYGKVAAYSTWASTTGQTYYSQSHAREILTIINAAKSDEAEIHVEMNIPQMLTAITSLKTYMLWRAFQQPDKNEYYTEAIKKYTEAQYALLEFEINANSHKEEAPVAAPKPSWLAPWTWGTPTTPANPLGDFHVFD